MKTELITSGRRSIRQVSFSPTKLTLAADFSDGLIRLWDLTTEKWKTALEGNKDFPSRLSWSQNNRCTLAFSNKSGGISLWNERLDLVIKELTEDSNYFLGPCWSPDGYTVAAGTLNGEICLWDTRYSEWQNIQKIADSYVLSVDYCFNGRYLTAETSSSSLLVLDQEKSVLIANLTDRLGKSSNVSWAPNKNCLAFGNSKSEVRVFNFKENKFDFTVTNLDKAGRLAEFGEQSEVAANNFATVAWEPTGNHLIVNSDGESILTYNIQTNEDRS